MTDIKVTREQFMRDANAAHDELEPILRSLSITSPPRPYSDEDIARAVELDRGAKS